MSGTAPKRPGKAITALRDNIALHLMANNRSQAQLSDHLGVSRTWVSKLLRGTRTMVSMWYLDAIAQYFGVEVYELFMPVSARSPVRGYLIAKPGVRLKETAPRGPRVRRSSTVIERAAKQLSRKR